MKTRVRLILGAAAIAALGLGNHAQALWFGTYGTWDTQTRKDAADAALTAVCNRFNAYGNFDTGSDGWIDVYYNSGVPTANASWYGAMTFGGTWPGERVALHEANHWLGSVYGHNMNGPRAVGILEQFDGVGARYGSDGTHFWPYGMNYDTEWSEVGAQRNIAIMYAQRADWGEGPTSNPTIWAATTVSLTGNDAVGESGFNFGSKWSDNTFAHPNASYSTGNFLLRTPASGSSFKFAGASVTVNNTNGITGGLLYKGTGSTGVTTFKTLNVDGGYVRHASNATDLFQLDGKVNLTQSPTIDAAQGSIKIPAAISGTGSLTKTGNYTLTLTNTNTYSGATNITAGTLKLAAPAAVANYTFANVSGTTVINTGTGGAAMNGTLVANGGTGSISTTGGPQAGLGYLQLNGNGSTVDINSGITDLAGDGNWTVSTWIKTTQAGATIFNKGDGTNWNLGASTFYLGDGTDGGAGGRPDAVRYAGGWVAGSTSVNNGAWHLVTYTNSAGTKTIYVDGVAVSLSQNQFNNYDSGSKVRIGFAANPGDGPAVTNGQLSGMRFYDTALSAAQVAQLYNSSAAANVLPSTTNVSISASATLDVNGMNQTIGSLTGATNSNIKLGNNGKLTTNSASNTTFAGNIIGTSATFTKSGVGTLTLSGVNSYSGSTVISGGTLKLSNPASVSLSNPLASYQFNNVSGNTVVNAGTLGAGANGTFNLNGGTGSINITGGPVSTMGALVLNGDGSTVDINNTVTSLSASSNWTVSAWIKTTQAGATIFNKGDGTNWNSGYSTFYLGDGDNEGSGGVPDAVRWGGGWLAGSTQVNDGNWHLLTFTNAAGTKAVYVDGVPDGVSQSAFNNTDTGSKIRIGFAPTNVDGELSTNGMLSGINIYNSALSAAQIAALYANTFSANKPLPVTTDLTIASGATLDVNHTTQTIGSLTGAAGSNILLGAGMLIVNQSTNTNFSGAISGVNGSITKSNTGTLTLSGASTYSGTTTVSAGKLLFTQAHQGAAAVSISSGAVLEVSANGTSSGVSRIRSLSIASSGGDYTGKYELHDNDLVIDYSASSSPYTATVDQVKKGLTLLGGNGQGITSDTVDAQTLPGTMLAVVDNGDPLISGAITSLSGYTIPNPATSVLVKFTWFGDSNLDGVVDGSDFALIDTGFTAGGSLTGWVFGDYDYNGVIDGSDYALIDTGFISQNGTLPEPGMLSIIGLTAMGMLRRNRR